MKLAFGKTYIAWSISEDGEERALIFDSVDEARAWKASEGAPPSRVETVADLYMNLKAHRLAIGGMAEEWSRESTWVVITACLAAGSLIPDEASLI